MTTIDPNQPQDTETAMNEHDQVTSPETPVADGDLQQRIDELTAEVARLQRDRLVDERLIEADVSDLETARVLAQRALGQMGEPDVDQAIDGLRRRTPWLFTRRARSAGASSPRADQGEAQQARAVSDAAQEAAATGRREDLLRYLRLRRSAG